MPLTPSYKMRVLRSPAQPQPQPNTRWSGPQHHVSVLGQKPVFCFFLDKPAFCHPIPYSQPFKLQLRSRLGPTVFVMLIPQVYILA